MGLTTLLVPGGTYTLNGEPVTREEFLTHAMPFVGLLVALSLVVVYGLWRHKGWVPLVVMGLWTALVAFTAGMALGSESPVLSLISGILPLLVPAAVSLWVFFGYEEVVQYYRHLRAMQAGARRSRAT
jgi:predicted RND superfamily exporter protein